MAKPTDWVGPFVERELAAVISWHNNNKGRSRESRFSDDGSNFRSTAKNVSLSDESLVQITEVKSCTEQVIVIISDGYSLVQAKLAPEAVKKFEEEIGGKIDLGTNNDVISIRKLIVISTPWGPAIERVQLQIEEIEYRHHLRRSFGDPEPLLFRKKAASLMEDIQDIRTKQYSTEDLTGSQEPEPTRANATATAVVSPQHGRQNGTNESHRVNSQRASSQYQSSPPKVTQQSLSTQPAIATQLPKPLNRKRKALNLDDDGVEVDNDQPVGLANRPPRTKDKRKPKANDSTRKVLLQHFGNRQNDMLHSGYSSSSTSPEPEPMEDVRLSSVAARSSHNATKDAPPRKSTSPQAAAATNNLQSPPQVQPVSQIGMRDYYRRALPVNQQSLIEKQESWMPPLPGKQFPHPNVPNELLLNWNAQAPSKEASSESPSPTPEEEDDSDAPLPWSQSPTQKRAMMPPDSTMGTAIQSTAPENRAQLPADDSSPPEQQDDSRGASSPSPEGELQLWPLPNTISSAMGSSAAENMPQRPADSDNDDLEMAVPRSRDQDPFDAHRKNRSDHFKQLQREKWLKDNYTIDLNAKNNSRSEAFAKYKSAYPSDASIKSGDFMEAIKAAFPELHRAGGKAERPRGLKLKSPAGETPVSRAEVEIKKATDKTDGLLRPIPKRRSQTILTKTNPAELIDLTADDEDDDPPATSTTAPSRSLPAEMRPQRPAQPKGPQNQAAFGSGLSSAFSAVGRKVTPPPAASQTPSSQLPEWRYGVYNPVATDKDIEPVSPPSIFRCKIFK